jgi:hypothetical protein
VSFCSDAAASGGVAAAVGAVIYCSFAYVFCAFSGASVGTTAETAEIDMAAREISHKIIWTLRRKASEEEA